MFVMAILETLGVASILPFMHVVSNSSLVQENHWFALFYDRLGFSSTNSFLVFLGVVALVMISVNNGFSAFTIWLMHRFAWSQNHRLSTRLLERYMERPYTFYLTRNTADLSKNILLEVQSVVQGVILAALRLVSRLLVAILIIGLLAAVDVQLALIVGLVLGTAYGLVYVLVRRKQRKLGKQRVRENGRRFQVSVEALAGIKELKVLGREKSFLKRFMEPSLRYCNVSASHQVISSLPKFALETIAYGGVLLIVLYFLRFSGDIKDMLPILSLYVFAGYRLMPSLNEIFTTAVLMRFNQVALKRLHEDLVDLETDNPDQVSGGGGQESDQTPLPLRKEVAMKNLSFTYPNTEIPSLESIDLSIRPCQIVGFVGETGAGKTTLVDLILGLLEPTEGVLEVDGEPVQGDRVQRWQRSCGYIPQVIFLSDDTIRANIAFGIPKELVDENAIVRAARMAQIDDFIATLPKGYDTEVGERGVRLSGGQRQRIGIARALYHDPAVLVMDEATSSLDGATEAGVMEMIHRLGKLKTLIVIAHRLSTVRACDVIYVLHNGRIIASGTYSDLASTNPYFRSMAGLGASASGQRQ
jgi:ABC-type multidrug transport system fused ATPase/permease subunit